LAVGVVGQDGENVIAPVSDTQARERLDAVDIPGLAEEFTFVLFLFEIFSNISPEKDKEYSEQEGKRIALAGGGRYDELVKLLGGKETPACGGAAGIERIIQLMKIMGKKVPVKKQPQVFLAQVGELSKRKVFRCFKVMIISFYTGFF